MIFIEKMKDENSFFIPLVYDIIKIIRITQKCEELIRLWAL